MIVVLKTGRLKLLNRRDVVEECKIHNATNGDQSGHHCGNGEADIDEFINALQVTVGRLQGLTAIAV